MRGFKMAIKIKRTGDTKSALNNGFLRVKQKLLEDVNIIKDLSVNLTPIDTGKLRKSAYVRKNKDDRTTIVYDVGYSADYALYVHENLNANHPIGQAKFLQTASRKHRQQMKKNIINAMNQGIRQKKVK